jgi:hypothetical protein
MLVQIFHDYWIEHNLIIDVHLKVLDGKDSQWDSSSGDPKKYAIEVTYFSSPQRSIRTLVRNYPDADYETAVKQLNKIARKINSIKKKEQLPIEEKS